MTNECDRQTTGQDEAVTGKAGRRFGMGTRLLGILAVSLALAGCGRGDAFATPPPAGEPPAATALSVPTEEDATPVAAPSGPTATVCAAIPTPAQTEGPYYKAGSPERTSLVEGDAVGVPLLLTGSVIAADCTPLAGVRVEFWQADGSGVYDNAGFRMRGHQFTDAGGEYRLETVIPGEYPGRTPHIHVKILDPDGHEWLTTQLYLTGVSDQIPDGLFDSRLLARDEPADGAGRRHVSFDFVLGP